MCIFVFFSFVSDSRTPCIKQALKRQFKVVVHFFSIVKIATLNTLKLKLHYNLNNDTKIVKIYSSVQRVQIPRDRGFIPPPPHTHTHSQKCILWRLLLFFLLLPNLRYSYRLCAHNSLWRPPVFRIPLWRPFFLFFLLSSVSTRYRISVHTPIREWPNPLRTSIVLSFVPVLNTFP